jgi:hypothetical protein
MGINNAAAGRGLESAVQVVEEVVHAWADGRVPPPVVAPNVTIKELRFAPSFQRGKDNGGPGYTEQNILDVLGVIGTKVYVQAALELCALFETHPHLRMSVMREIAKGKQNFRPRALLRMFGRKKS